MSKKINEIMNNCKDEGDGNLNGDWADNKYLSMSNSPRRKKSHFFPKSLGREM